MVPWEISYQLEELPQWVEKIRQQYPEQRFFALIGELGAGKTTFVSEFCRQLGAQDEASSPTFSIVNEYATAKGPIFHLDCYRLKSVEEAMDIGIEEYFEQAYFCFIEWPELIEPFLPQNVVYLRFEHYQTVRGEPCRLLYVMPPSYE